MMMTIVIGTVAKVGVIVANSSRWPLGIIMIIIIIIIARIAVVVAAAVVG